MKKLIGIGLACIALMSMAMVASAQDTGSKEKGDKIQKQGKLGQGLNKKRIGLQQALKELKLTDEQKKQIKEIMVKAKKDVKAIQDGTDTSEVKKTKIKAIREESRKSIMNLLTDEQKKKLEELIGKNKSKGKGKGTKGSLTK